LTEVEVAREAQRSGYKKVGLIGTTYTMASDFYPTKLGEYGIEQEMPGAKDRDLINKIIFDELVAAQFTATSRAYFTAVINDLAERGCEAVVLGCTEIPLIVTFETSPLPLLDSTRLLARAALNASLK
jgi:aspartate racemase